MTSPRLLLALVGALAACHVASADDKDKKSEAVAVVAARAEADPGQGFHWPYFVYVPTKLRETPGERPRTFLVLPNNTWRVEDDPAVHERSAKRLADQYRPWADKLGVILLVPAFPRPGSDWRAYTHALDRDSLLIKKEPLRRLDQQLLAMIDHARTRLKADGVATDRQVLLLGFSASGMFANRFTFLHPERVKAAAVGSPGGWPLAPVAQVQKQTLRYPVGVADMDSVAGKSLDLKELARVPLFFFMGDQDKNDSVVFRDSYEEEDEKLIGELFGKTPVERWPAAERLYQGALPKATFKLYPGAAHRFTPDMVTDVQKFFASELSQPHRVEADPFVGTRGGDERRALD